MIPAVLPTLLGLTGLLILAFVPLHLAVRRGGGWRAAGRALGREAGLAVAVCTAPARARLRHRRQLRLLTGLLTEPEGWVAAEQAMLRAEAVAPGVEAYAVLLGADVAGVFVGARGEPPRPGEPWVADELDPLLWWIDRADLAGAAGPGYGTASRPAPPLLVALGVDLEHGVLVTLLDLVRGPATVAVGGEPRAARAVLQSITAQLDARLPAGALTVADGVHDHHGGPDPAAALAATVPHGAVPAAHPPAGPGSSMGRAMFSDPDVLVVVEVLRTIAGSAARTASCADVHLYGIDAGGGGLAALEALPHCGAVVSRHDTERIERLLNRLVAELTERQERCGEHGVAGLNELRAALPARQRPAHILLLIDGWDALAGVLGEHDNGRLMDLVTRLLREGAAMGVHVVATSERALLGGRLAAHNDHRLLLRQGDRADYQLIGLPPSAVPPTIPPGRGWHVLTGTETQVALLAPGTAGGEQVEALREIGAEAARRDAKVPAERRPFRVAPLPRSVDFAAAYERVPAQSRRPMWGLLGIGGDEAGPVGVDFAGPAPVFAVLGPPRTGRSNTLAALSVSLLAGGTSLVVLTPRDSPLRSLARHPRARVLTDPDPSEEQVTQALEALPGPRVVVIDDADLLGVPACDRVLRRIAISGRDHGLGLL